MSRYAKDQRGLFSRFPKHRRTARLDTGDMQIPPPPPSRRCFRERTTLSPARVAAACAIRLVPLAIASKWRTVRLAPLPNDNCYTTAFHPPGTTPAGESRAARALERKVPQSGVERRVYSTGQKKGGRVFRVGCWRETGGRAEINRRRRRWGFSGGSDR